MRRGKGRENAGGTGGGRENEGDKKIITLLSTLVGICLGLPIEHTYTHNMLTNITMAHRNTCHNEIG